MTKDELMNLVNRSLFATIGQNMYWLGSAL